MTKNIIKEIIVILLLTLAIILVLGVLLYEYVPANKIIPEKISYTTPEDVKTELETDIDESEEELYVDYHIDSTQLNNYKKIQEYVPGRKNPFGEVETEETSTTTSNENQNGAGTTTTNKGNQSSTGITTTNKENQSSTGTTTTTEENSGYLPDKGTK